MARTVKTTNNDEPDHVTPRSLRTFHGETSRASDFLTQAYMAFATSPAYFATDQAKILFMASAFEGNAFKWWRVQLKQKARDHNLDEYDAGSIVEKLTFDGFKSAFLSQFGSSKSTVWDAETYLISAQQGNRTVADYATIFQSITRTLDFTW